MVIRAINVQGPEVGQACAIPANVGRNGGGAGADLTSSKCGWLWVAEKVRRCSTPDAQSTLVSARCESGGALNPEPCSKEKSAAWPTVAGSARSGMLFSSHSSNSEISAYTVARPAPDRKSTRLN